MVNNKLYNINTRSSQQGAIYIWMLLSLLFLSLGVGQWSINYATLKQREKEEELLKIGLMYRKAIYQYYQSSPGGVKTYPEKLEDLLRDPRYLEVKRYLRKLEKDPMTSKDFLIIKNSENQIIGIYSSSSKKTIKKSGFLPSLEKFEKVEKYQDWKFIM
ncbi:type II secretion system protein [Acinetobacter pittii]|uniref:type II secretion system protein n=1 Tax=Acinetobacter pittii TaxID=48296 RepID=UPI002029BDC9|nr:type II secretion system protein [Acinetobacter pittii]WPP58346.1 type II secretion system protein [Acinetobacter pittii]